jgi:hypothetical protein
MILRKIKTRFFAKHSPKSKSWMAFDTETGFMAHGETPLGACFNLDVVSRHLAATEHGCMVTLSIGETP